MIGQPNELKKHKILLVPSLVKVWLRICYNQQSIQNIDQVKLQVRSRKPE